MLMKLLWVPLLIEPCRCRLDSAKADRTDRFCLEELLHPTDNFRSAARLYHVTWLMHG